MATAGRRSIRIGGVPYGVGSRLLHGLDANPGVDLSVDRPVRLVERLREGDLDAALLSSIEAFRRPGYRALADIGICSRGAVLSVRAFVRRGIQKTRSVGLDAGSESSVALLRILFANGRLPATEADCRYERIEPTTEPDLLPHDVVMLIGDAGLRAEPGGRVALDLGELWHEWTGLPFVFALWLIAPSVADPERVAELLRDAREESRVEPRSEAEGAVRYDLGPDEMRGLVRFRDEARRLGLAEPGVEPRFLDDPHGGGIDTEADER